MVNTMAHIPQRIARSCAVALLSLAAAAPASAAGVAAPLDPPSLGGSLTSSAGAGAAARLIVTPSGHAYVVLNIEPQQRDGAIAGDILYLAGEDPVELARAGAQERLASAAREVVAAITPLLEVSPLQRVSIAAVFGKPGRSGIAERHWFTRQEGGWRAEARASERAAAQVPEVPASALRDAESEARAHAVAAGFISDADRSDYDAAWAKTSAVVKAAMSRADFDRSLAELARPRRDDGAPYLCFPVAAGRFLPGTNVEAWLARETATGPIVEVLALRLDDDLQWRVAAVVEMTRTTAPGPTAGGADQQAIEAAGSL